MGYRSEVAYRIVFRDKRILNEFIALVMVKGEQERKALSECEIEGGNDGTYFVNFYACDVKWYDSFPDVMAHTWLYTFAIDRFPDDCAYTFIRIGEDRDDNIEEDRGSDDFIDYVRDDFYITRGMELPFSHAYEPVGDKLALIP